MARYLGGLTTTTTVTSSVNTSVSGQQVTFAATVTPPVGATDTPSGLVNFIDPSTSPGTLLGSAMLANGSASITLAAGLPTPNRIVAEYAGDALFASSSATIFTVTSSTDVATDPTFTGSLRYAIAQVDASDSTTNTIKFSPAVSGQTITLTSPLPQITNNVMILGTVSTGTTVSGNNQYQVFNIASGKSVTISDLTITSGRSVTKPGVTIDQGSATPGGGIENAGTLNVLSCMLSSNTADTGGAIDNSGTLSVTSSTFSNNSALEFFGGAIDNSGTLTVTSSKFTNNSDLDLYGSTIYSSGMLQGHEQQLQLQLGRLPVRRRDLQRWRHVDDRIRQHLQ